MSDSFSCCHCKITKVILNLVWLLGTGVAGW